MKITVTLAGIKTTQFAAGSANRNNEYYFESDRNPTKHPGHANSGKHEAGGEETH